AHDGRAGGANAVHLPARCRRQGRAGVSRPARRRARCRSVTGARLRRRPVPRRRAATAPRAPVGSVRAALHERHRPILLDAPRRDLRGRRLGAAGVLFGLGLSALDRRAWVQGRYRRSDRSALPPAPRRAQAHELPEEPRRALPSAATSSRRTLRAPARAREAVLPSTLVALLAAAA